MTDISTSPTLAGARAEELAPEARSAATFEVLPLSREVRETLAEIGYTHPTPVQIAVWEPATRGKDAVVQARTGTGKTAAFGLPIVDHIVRRSMPQVQTLVLTPTRELALQVGAEIERLGKKKNVRVAAIYGGAPMQRQIDQIADGAQVIVGTPGRVLDHLRRGTLNPKHVRLLVLDESDEMLSMGFEREVTAILDTLPKDRQTLLFSATVPPDIERMAKKLRAPEYITLSGDHIGALEIEHFVYMVASDKLGALVRMLEVENPENAVIFCNTKDETERVAQALSRQGFDADWLNGDLPQSDREKVMTATRSGRLRFLVATDVAARGIDISHLTHVINHDFPQDAESYVHRTGRTGRAGRTGTAISLIMPQDVGGLYLLRLTYKIRPIEKQIPSEGELKTRAEADLVTMLAEAFASRPAHPDDLALARRLLTHEQGDVILAGLLRDHLGARPTAKQESAAARRATRAIPAKAADLGPADAAHPASGLKPRAPAEPTRTIARPPVTPPAVPAAAPVAPTQAPAIAAAPIAAPIARLPVAPPPAAPIVSPPAPPAAPIASAPAAPIVNAPRPAVDEVLRPARPTGEDPRRGREEERGDRRGRGGFDARRGRGDGRGRGRGDGREDYTPVSAAEGIREVSPEARRGPPQRHADFTSWQPPAEEGDDEPILGSDDPRRRDRDRPRPLDSTRAALRADAPVDNARAALRADAPVDNARAALRADAPVDNARAPQDLRRPSVPAIVGAPAAASAAPRTPAAAGPQAAVHAGGLADEQRPAADFEGEFAEIYVNVGRREGARAADYQRILTERAGIDKANVRRIRVRERNAFVSVRREDLLRAIAALTGATIAGKVAAAEQARERSGGEGDADAPGAEPGPAADAATTTPPAREERASAGDRDPTGEIATIEMTTTKIAPAIEAAPPAEASVDAPVSDESVPTGRGPGAPAS
jgi:ATP-dependent RNA helicase DeaD